MKKKILSRTCILSQEYNIISFKSIVEHNLRYFKKVDAILSKAQNQ